MGAKVVGEKLGKEVIFLKDLSEKK